MRFDLSAFRFVLRRDFWASVWRRINDDHCWGMAAELSYYFLLAFFPFLILVSAVIALAGVEPGLVERMLNELGPFLPLRTQRQVAEIVANLTEWQGTSVILLWLMMALWAASLGLNGMASVLNRAYGVKDERSYFRVRGLSVVVTLKVSLFVILSGLLLFLGDDLSRLTIERLPLAGESLLLPILRMIYSGIRWLLILVFLNLGIQIVYFALPARRLPWRLFSPGSIVASLGWLLGSLAFAFYINSFADYQRMYGSLGDLVILMIWFYFSSLFLLVGGEMDSEIFGRRRAPAGERSAQ